MRPTETFLTCLLLTALSACGKPAATTPAGSESTASAAAPSTTEHAQQQATAEASDAGEAPAAAAPVAEAPATETQAVAAAEAPGLRDKLQARHPEDLPSYDDLLAMEGAESGLRWLAENDETLLVRARALDLLGHFDHAGTVAYLQAVLADTDAHDKLKAASVLGLGRTNLSTHQAARDDLLALAAGDNVRLALEAVHVLTDVPEARPALDEIARADATLEAVKSALIP